jgi:hypothetical protein
MASFLLFTGSLKSFSEVALWQLSKRRNAIVSIGHWDLLAGSFLFTGRLRRSNRHDALQAGMGVERAQQPLLRALRIKGAIGIGAEAMNALKRLRKAR